LNKVAGINGVPGKIPSSGGAGSSSKADGSDHPVRKSLGRSSSMQPDDTTAMTTKVGCSQAKGSDVSCRIERGDFGKSLLD
jgi:hypothetical protein